MRVVGLMLYLCCSVVLANPAVDLEKTMKNMAFQYKQANDTADVALLLPVLDNLINLTTEALQADFAADKAESFTRGLRLVLAELDAAKAAAQQGNIALAKSHLRQVDLLRKDYHKQREVSLWQLFFGRS